MPVPITRRPSLSSLAARGRDWGCEVLQVTRQRLAGRVQKSCGPRCPAALRDGARARWWHDFVPTGKRRLGSNCPGNNAVITPPPLADAGPRGQLGVYGPWWHWPHPVGRTPAVSQGGNGAWRGGWRRWHSWAVAELEVKPGPSARTVPFVSGPQSPPRPEV